MGNSTGNTVSTELDTPSTAFEENRSLNTACCACRKENPIIPDANETQGRRGISYTSLNMSAARNAPYTSRLGIEESITSNPVPSTETGMPAYRIKSPEPLTSWTSHEQQVLVDLLNKHPQARENESYRQRLLERVQQELPSKSLEEIKECYAYLREVRLACVKSRRSSLNQPASPRLGSEFSRFQT